MSKKALGKGIGALLSAMDNKEDKNKTVSPVITDESIVKVNINNIMANPDQPRKEFKEDALRELADSIKEKGVIQPILVEKKDDNTFIIVAGERRYRASKLAGLSEMPVIVKSFTEEDKYEIALIENIQREDLNPIEEAMAYKKIMDSFDLSQEQVAKKVGKNRSTIANSLRLLKLPEDMQNAVSAGKLTSGHARSILAVINPADQTLLFHRIIDDSLSVREAERNAIALNQGNKTLNKPPKEKEKIVPPKSVELQELEQKLMDLLGTKVNISGSDKKGKIEIHYFSLDDLNRIYDIVDLD